MEDNEDVLAISADLGYGGFDEIRKDFPDRFLNTGAAEQAMLGIAVGLALEGKIPFCYTITPFYLRAMETISLYLLNNNIHVCLVGSGRDDDYNHDGPSHNATQTQYILNTLAIKSYYPQTKEEIPALIDKIVKIKKPYFISLKR